MGANIYLQDEIVAKIKERNKYDLPVGVIANEHLGNYYAMLDVALTEVDITINEACYLTDLLNGTVVNPSLARMLWAEVEEGASMEYLDEKWNVDLTSFREKLKSFSAFQCLALADAAKKYWDGEYEVSNNFHESVAKIFKIKKSKLNGNVPDDTAKLKHFNQGAEK